MNDFALRMQLLAILCFLVTVQACTQSEINKTASDREQNGITHSEGYNFKIIDGEVSNDSILAVTRNFNKRGYRTETAVYRNGALSTTYAFEYAHDTLLVSMKTYKGPEKSFMQESLFKYDKKQNLLKQYQADQDNGPNLSTKNKYNKLGQLVKTTFKSMNRKISEDKYKYDVHGNMVERISCVPTKERFVYTYDNENRLTHTYKVLHDGKKNLRAYYDYAPRKKTKHKLHNSKSWLGINGTIKLSYSDILTKEETIGIANQITEEIEYLNGTLNGFRKYYYQ